ncbi:hypothetical protein AQUSIP_25430 [Aquicella siphonis]|uniref:Uncharacterized protein n=1 Tax=Aquicella siphonis TaxID=254247 RepID=A0A5E4PLW9_9COXI|nr:hypothetical protein AQUSIP_25430 [Aquicella siphonis]
MEDLIYIGMAIVFYTFSFVLINFFDLLSRSDEP